MSQRSTMCVVVSGMMIAIIVCYFVAARTWSAASRRFPNAVVVVYRDGNVDAQAGLVWESNDGSGVNGWSIIGRTAGLEVKSADGAIRVRLKYVDPARAVYSRMSDEYLVWIDVDGVPVVSEARLALRAQQETVYSNSKFAVVVASEPFDTDEPSVRTSRQPDEH